MGRLLLAGSSVFDVRSGEVAEADVEVADDRIVAAGRGLDADEAVDCSGVLLVPGFIDCHTHVAMVDEEGSVRAAAFRSPVAGRSDARHAPAP